MKKLRKLSLHTHFTIRTIITVIGVILVLMAQASSQNDMTAGVILGLVLIIIGMIWHILFVRCPHCGNHLSLRRMIPRYCPWCGKQIDKFH